MAQSLELFGSAPYLGDEQCIRLVIRFGERSSINVEFDGDKSTVVEAEIAEGTTLDHRYNLNTAILGQLREQYSRTACEKPTKLLDATWQKILNDLWKRALPE